MTPNTCWLLPIRPMPGVESATVPVIHDRCHRAFGNPVAHLISCASCAAQPLAATCQVPPPASISGNATHWPPGGRPLFASSDCSTPRHSGHTGSSATGGLGSAAGPANCAVAVAVLPPAAAGGALAAAAATAAGAAGLTALLGAGGSAIGALAAGVASAAGLSAGCTAVAAGGAAPAGGCSTGGALAASPLPMGCSADKAAAGGGACGGRHTP